MNPLSEGYIYVYPEMIRNCKTATDPQDVSSVQLKGKRTKNIRRWEEVRRMHVK
jgi:hypothetical protein